MRMTSKRTCGLSIMLIVTAVTGSVVLSKWRSREQRMGNALLDRPTKEVETTPDEMEYVGSASCTKCHSEAAETYRAHPMGNSMQALEQTPLGTERRTIQFEARDRYVVEQRGDGIWHHKMLVAEDGRVLVDQSVPVQYAMGSGTRGRSFIIDQSGALYMSPISWYANGDRWDISPGYESRPQAGSFERRITERCAHCHVGMSRPVRTGLPDCFRRPPFQELVIGCERCHGPGREHVRRHSADSVLNADADQHIVNPSKLDPQRRDHVCYQCHLQGVWTELRPNKRFHDFRPGQLLDDVWVVLVAGTSVESQTWTKAVSQVEQMRASRCYVASQGRLGCISCHDAHRTPDRDRLAEHYRARCQSCHADRSCTIPLTERTASAERNSCIACHMPNLQAADVAHTAQTDHRIVRRPPTNSSAAESTTAPPLELFDGAAERLPAWEVDRSLGLGLLLGLRAPDPAQITRANVLLYRALSSQPNDLAIRRALGRIELITGNQTAARRHFDAALRAQPQDEETLALLSGLAFATNDFATCLEVSTKRLQIDPSDADTTGRLAVATANLGHMDDAIRLAERAVELSPASLALRSVLVDLLQRAGRKTESRNQQDLLEAIRNRRGQKKEKS